MAITKDPLSVATMIETKAESSGFSSMKDNLRKQAADLKNNISNSLDSIKSSVLDKINLVQTGLDRLGSSTFSDILCCKTPSASLRVDLYNNALDRGLGKGLNVDMCELSKIKNPIDTILALTNVINNYPGLLQGSMEDRLNYLIRSDLLAKMNILGLGNVIPTCIFGNTINNLAGTSGPIGANVHDKNELRALMQQNPCAATLANQPLISGWLSNSVTANLINVLIDSKTNGFNFYRFLDATLLSTGQRSSVLGGLIASIAYANDYNTSVKMQGIHYVITNGNLTPDEYNILKYSTADLLKKLDKERENNSSQIDGTSAGGIIPKPGESSNSNGSSNPTINKPTKQEEFTILKETLDVLDPTWKIWDVTGTKTACELSNGTLRSREVRNITLTDTVTTKLETEHKIAITCAFKHQNGLEHIA